MRSLAGAVLLGLSAVGCASFEMLLVADNGNATFATRRIHRYDPVTAVYLGSFGGFNAQIISTHLNQASRSLFVLSTIGVTEWDYNTGLQKNAFAFGASSGVTYSIRPSLDRMAAFSSGSSFEVGNFPVPSSYDQSGLLSDAVYRTGLWTNSSTLVALESAHSRFVTVSFNPSATSSTITATSTFTGPSTGWGQMTLNGGTSNIIMASGNLGGFFLYTPGNPNINNFAGTVGGTAMSAASAHSGFFIGSNQGATGRIDYFDRYFGLTRQFGSGTVVSPVSMQTVLAPEPGQLTALGVGLVGILSRRRKSVQD